jgi:aminoglycoside phosphotransferase family enzyme/predicted kinase
MVPELYFNQSLSAGHNVMRSHAAHSSQKVNPAPFVMPSVSSPLIASLLKPGTYDHPVEDIELIETHISRVFLTGKFVYKIKKPVNLGFADFSTLEKRRHFCAEEVRLNQRLAPDTYIGVVAITGSHAAPRLISDQASVDAIEYAVKMRQFPSSAQLDRMLDRGELEGRHLDAFAWVIADFHQRVSVAGADLCYGDPDEVLRPVKENFPDLYRCLPDPASTERILALEAWTDAEFSKLRNGFASRKQDGFVRECHGDLHLRNLAWIDEGPLVFDCLEFNPELRWIDVMSEVAFLVMDLQARGQAGLASRFLNQYLERAGDYAGLAILPFYLVYRALVRAKVEGIRALQADVDVHEKGAAELACRSYLALPQRYTQREKPRLIVTRGVSASGKTTVSNLLLESLSAIRIRSDVERKRLAGLAAETDARAEVNRGIYDVAGSRETYARLLDLAGQVLAAGFTVIVDAAFLQAGQLQPFQSLAAKRGIACTIIEVSAPEAVLRERIVNRARGASDADLTVLEHQLKAWQPLTPDESVHALRVDTSAALDLDKLMDRLR